MAAAMNQAQPPTPAWIIDGVDGCSPALKQGAGVQDTDHEDEMIEADCVLDTRMEGKLKAKYHNVKDLLKRSIRQPQKETGFFDTWELYHVANELKMSVDDVVLVRGVFDSFDEDRNGALDAEEFEEAVLRLLQLQLKDHTVSRERMKTISGWCYWDNHADDSGTVDFMQFLKWYSSNGFSEELLLSEDQRWLRKIATEYDLPLDYVELIKRNFDSYDSDSSGYIDHIEFKQVLQKLLKIPPNCELPPSRIRYFWSQINSDGSGKATFEVFLRWYNKNFSEESSSDYTAPFQDFYKHVRFGRKPLDPPAYAPNDGGASPKHAQPTTADNQRKQVSNLLTSTQALSAVRRETFNRRTGVLQLGLPGIAK
mmetsp:Transcript_104557/g.294637  ORF Transcript_104557/g.294637 Transcript_104557/m.294637 type:complete len:368 (+) Transcript_104557:2-1105(+)